MGVRAVAVKEEKRTTQFKSLFWAARLARLSRHFKPRYSPLSLTLPCCFHGGHYRGRMEGEIRLWKHTAQPLFCGKNVNSLYLKGRGGCWGYMEIWICSIPVCLPPSLHSGTQQCVMAAWNSHSLAGFNFFFYFIFFINQSLKKKKHHKNITYAFLLPSVLTFPRVPLNGQPNEKNITAISSRASTF